jgi:hypothetical protein
MVPNLRRIPGKGDWRAKRVLDSAPALVDIHFLDSLSHDLFLDLGRYGHRLTTIALRERSRDKLRDALLAVAISALDHNEDERDFMVGLGLHFYVAEQLGMEPAALFDEIAGRLPDGPLSKLLRVFGARQDVTLEGFGWRLIATDDGLDFLPV